MSYNGWANWATWAMALDIGNDETIYRMAETAARVSAVGNEESPDDFHAELSEAMERLGTMLAEMGLLPDFSEGDREKDLADVDWQEIAGHYPLEDYA